MIQWVEMVFKMAELACLMSLDIVWEFLTGRKKADWAISGAAIINGEVCSWMSGEVMAGNL